MRHKWDTSNGGLALYTADKGWVYVGWVEEAKGGIGFRVFCCWFDDGDYPENKLFETDKQARRALKSAATVAIIGGFRGLHT
jgi:hypothetical protein